MSNEFIQKDGVNQLIKVDDVVVRCGGISTYSGVALYRVVKLTPKKVTIYPFDRGEMRKGILKDQTPRSIYAKLDISVGADTLLVINDIAKNNFKRI